MNIPSSLRRFRPVWLLAPVIVVVVIGLVYVFGVSPALATPSQPLVFQHSKHVAAGVNCLFCHPGVTRGAVAGLPSEAKCMGCHIAVTPKDPRDQADIDRLIKQWETRQPIKWVKVVEEPDFVHFNHRPHIAKGVACESCHGNIAAMGYAQSYNLNMGFCLNCHRQQAPDKVARLVDCATCHY